MAYAAGGHVMGVFEAVGALRLSTQAPAASAVHGWLLHGAHAWPGLFHMRSSGVDGRGSTGTSPESCLVASQVHGLALDAKVRMQVWGKLQGEGRPACRASAVEMLLGLSMLRQ